MHASRTFRFAIASLLIMTMASCTLIKPIACAAVFPIHQFQKSPDSDPDREYSELPAAGVIVAAPVLIPLHYVYYFTYGAVGGLVSGFVNDLNMVTGHGSIRNSRRTMYEPLRTNALRK